MKILNYENIIKYDKIKILKIIKIGSYYPKIRVFSSVFRVFSYVFLRFFESVGECINYEIIIK